MKRLLTSLAALALLPVASAAEINVTFSEELTEDLIEDYGEKEGDFLIEEITEDLEKAFEKYGVDPAKVDVTIIDARPNRPTFKQLGKPGLSFQSVSVGRLKLEASAYDADGNLILFQEHRSLNRDIRDSVGAGTWYEVKRSSDRFARKFAKTIAGQSSSPAS
ncbi:MAG: hypothetical protein QNI84_13795 [Henriciella sp.]|nr:hypothetical protein [Henriciella sp.]